MAFTTALDPAAALPATTDTADAERAREERAWVARARAGDTEAFRALVERHQARAVALARRVLRDPREAEEAAQDAFLKAWTALPGFREEARFGTWLHRIVLRRALDRLDALRARRRHEGAAPAWPEDGATGRDGEADDVPADRLRAHVDALPPAQRAAVMLFYFEDRSVLEAARTLGMPENTFKTHLHRARAALRAAWVRDAGETR